MTRISEVLWPVKSPPDGFAKATVERMMAVDRVAPETARSNRWLVLALAAVFVSGVAYGLGFRGREASQPIDPSAPFHAMAAATPMMQRVPCVTPPRPPVMEFARPARAPAHSTAPSAMVVAPVRVAPSGPPKIPACQCERGFSDVICDCY